MQLFGTDLLRTYWAHDVKMTSMRRYVASTSLRRHVPAGNLAPLGPPNILNLGPPNILNLPTPMQSQINLRLYIVIRHYGLIKSETKQCLKHTEMCSERIWVFAIIFGTIIRKFLAAQIIYERIYNMYLYICR